MRAEASVGAHVVGASLRHDLRLLSSPEFHHIRLLRHDLVLEGGAAESRLVLGMFVQVDLDEVIAFDWRRLALLGLCELFLLGFEQCQTVLVLFLFLGGGGFAR